MIVLEADNLGKTYRTAADKVAAVRDASLSLSRGELVLLMGPSGSGKTTLLSMLGCILPPDDGALRVCGDEVAWNESELPATRRRCFGFVYQSFNLLSALSVRENVALPLMFAGQPAGVAEELAEHALATVGMMHRATYDPALLSGGERQRVAIARAIAGDAPIVLADEPTGSLDSENGRKVMSILQTLARERRKAVLVVSHDDRHVPYADRVLRMEDGELVNA